MTRYLISVGADVNAAPKYEESAHFKSRSLQPMVTRLRVAVTTGQLEILELVLSHGADVNTVCESGDYLYTIDPADHRPWQFWRDSAATALQAAAAGGNIDLVLALLQAGSRINEPAHGYGGRTALYAAAAGGFSDVVELLLHNGAEVNAAGTACLQYPRTPLLAAVEQSNLTLVELLLKLGADPNAPSFGSHGTTVLEAARAQKNNIKMVSVLSKYGSKDDVDFYDAVRAGYLKVRLVQAFDCGNIETIHRGLEMGGEIGMEMIPCNWNQVLLSAWSDHSTHMTSGTILHWAAAAKETDSKLFRHLVEAVKDVNDQGYFDSIPPILHEVVYRQKSDFIQILLDVGADINALSPVARLGGRDNIETCTPAALHVALYLRNFEIVFLLLNNGADVNLRLHGTPTPLQILLRSSSDSRFELDSLLIIPIFEFLLEFNADINAPQVSPKDSSWSNRATASGTALQLAAGRKPISHTMIIVRRLLSLQANVNAPALNDFDVSALQTASESGNLEVVVLLLDHGALVNPSVPQKMPTALQYAAYKGHIRLAQLLIDRGADVNIQSFSWGRTASALELAVIFGRLDMVQVLIIAGADPNLPFESRYKKAKLAKMRHNSAVAPLL